MTEEAPRLIDSSRIESNRFLTETNTHPLFCLLYVMGKKRKERRRKRRGKGEAAAEEAAALDLASSDAIHLALSDIINYDVAFEIF